MKHFLIFLAVFIASALGAALVHLSLVSQPSVANLLVAIVLGGIGGGFTLGLIGGERYGLKLPGKVGHGHKIDPGFLGDMFVGLMSGFLGIGIASQTLRSELFVLAPAKTVDKVVVPQLVELWFLDFSIAFVCGFLGLRLVKAVSERFFQATQLKEGLERVEHNEGATAFLSGQSAIDMGQLEEAETEFRRALRLDPDNSVRALTGLGRVYKRQKRYDDAIEAMNNAIGRKDLEPVKSRVAVVYWNRACYRALALSSDKRPETGTLDDVFHDLNSALLLQPSFREDLYGEPDLTTLREDDRFKKLADQPAQSDRSSR